MERRIAISDHCLCVSNPRCLRTSSKVTSNCQRITNQERIFRNQQQLGMLPNALREQWRKGGQYLYHLGGRVRIEITSFSRDR